MSKRGPDRGGPQGGANKRRSHGKPMIKILCPYYCAGAIIGKGGETIKELMDRTDCDVKISKTDERFPTTSERVVSIQGESKSVEECVLFCQDKIRKDEPPPNAKRESHLTNAKRKECCKVVVSDTSAGRIIGKGGQRIKDLKNDYNVVINISRKDEMPRGFEERCVSVEGEDGNVDNCVREIVKLVCEDETASMEWHVFYNDWNERRNDRGFDDRGGFGGRDGGRDFGGRENYGGGRGEDYGGRDNYRGNQDSYGSGRDGGYNSYSGGGGGGGGGGGRDDYRSDNYNARDGGRDDRDRGMGGRDYGRDSGRDSGRDNYGGGARDAGFGGGRDAGYGGGDRYSSRDTYSARDSYGGGGRDTGYGGGRDDMRRDPSPVRRDPSFGRNDSFGMRDAPREEYGAREGGRGYRDGGYRDGGRNSMPERRDDFRAGGRDNMSRGGGRY